MTFLRRLTWLDGVLFAAFLGAGVALGISLGGHQNQTTYRDVASDVQLPDEQTAADWNRLYSWALDAIRARQFDRAAGYVHLLSTIVEPLGDEEGASFLTALSQALRSRTLEDYRVAVNEPAMPRFAELLAASLATFAFPIVPGGSPLPNTDIAFLNVETVRETEHHLGGVTWSRKSANRLEGTVQFLSDEFELTIAIFREVNELYMSISYPPDLGNEEAPMEAILWSARPFGLVLFDYTSTTALPAEPVRREPGLVIVKLDDSVQQEPGLLRGADEIGILLAFSDGHRLMLRAEIGGYGRIAYDSTLATWGLTPADD